MSDPTTAHGWERVAGGWQHRTTGISIEFTASHFFTDAQHAAAVFDFEKVHAAAARLGEARTLAATVVEYLDLGHASTVEELREVTLRMRAQALALLREVTP